MPLSLSLGAGSLPGVLVVIPGADVPSGSSWSVAASTPSGFTWAPAGASGTGAGEQVVLVDTVAPVNEALSYSLTVDGALSSTATITRAYTGTGGDGLARDIIASVDAGTVAAVRRERSDAFSGDRRFHASMIAGRAYPVLRLDAVAGAGGGSMTVATVGAHTTTLRRLLVKQNTVLVAYHDASRCGLDGCPVAPVTVMYVVDHDDDIGARVDVGERVWSLSYLAQPLPEADQAAGLQTFDDLDAAALTFDQLDALGLTLDLFDRTIWSEVGA